MMNQCAPLRAIARLAACALLAMSLAAMVSGCGKSAPSVTLAEAPLTFDQIHLLIVAEQPRDPEGQADREVETRKWFNEFVTRFQATAVRAGFKVVTEGDHHARVTLKADGLKVGRRLYEGSVISAIFETPDRSRVIASIEHRQEESIRPAGTQDYVAILLMNKIGESRRVTAYFGGNVQADPGRAQPVAGRNPRRTPPRSGARKASRVEFVTGAPQRNAYALVIGIESYRDVQTKATGALKDAKLFKYLAATTMGIPKKHIRLALGSRATKVDIEKHVDWLVEHAPKGGRIYFFFSGHGAPDASSGTPYLLPYDGDASALERTALPLKEVLKRLEKSKARETVAFVDTCFSGSGGRSVLPKGARPLVRIKDPPKTSRVVLFSAASGAQISGPSRSGKNGLFTHFLTTGLGKAEADMDGDGQVTLDELSQWITPRVEREARDQGRDQTPKLTAPPAVATDNVVIAHGVQ